MLLIFLIRCCKRHEAGIGLPYSPCLIKTVCSVPSSYSAFPAPACIIFPVRWELRDSHQHNDESPFVVCVRHYEEERVKDGASAVFTVSGLAFAFRWYLHEIVQIATPCLSPFFVFISLTRSTVCGIHCKKASCQSAYR